MVRWLLCCSILFFLFRFLLYTKWAHGVLQIGEWSNSKWILLHLRCTMAFIHSFIHPSRIMWIILAQTETQTPKKEETNARNIHIKCIEIASHFHCLFVQAFFSRLLFHSRSFLFLCGKYGFFADSHCHCSFGFVLKCGIKSIHSMSRYFLFLFFQFRWCFSRFSSSAFFCSWRYL